MRACRILSGMRSTGKSARTAGDLPFLSVVIPVFNEQEWVARAVEAAVRSLDSAGWPAELVVVDDGSTDSTPAILVELADRIPDLTVISQDNAGRFAARRAGVAAANGEYVLLLDARVLLDETSLAYVARQMRTDPQRQVWNGHIIVESPGGPYGYFWSGLVAVAWRKYFQNPRLTDFGYDEFDLYPKGTGLLLLPRGLMEKAAESFSSLFSEQRLASDDTRMLRWISAQERISLSPEFVAHYVSRDSFAKYLRHSYFRGTTFVDGYLDSPGVVRRNAGVASAVAVLGVALLAVRPRLALGILLSAQGGAALVVRKCGGSPAEARSVGMLLPVFAACFGSGVVRGLLLARRNRK